MTILMMLRLALLLLSALLFVPTVQAMPKAELVLAIRGEPDRGFDPLFGWGQYGHPLFQSTLLRRDPALRTEPDLATAWTLSEDRLTWTISIRPDARFSDGTPVTAEDVAFTFREAAVSAGSADLTVLESATVLDSSRFALRLKEPRITFVESFYTLGIVPAKAYGEGYGQRPLGSGPYRLVQWTKGQQLIVDANPHYYGAKPPFTRLTFLFTDEDTTFVAAQAGRVDMAAAAPSLADKVPTGMRRVVAQTVDNRGLMFPMVPNTGQRNLRGASIGNDVTADRAIRKAINVVIDREALVKGILNGHGSAAYGPADGLPWSNPEARLPGGNSAAAREILAKGGWQPGRNGILVKDGREARFTILYPATDSTRQMLALAVADMLRPIGIAAEAAGKSWNEIYRGMHSNAVLFAGAATTRSKFTRSITAVSPGLRRTIRAITRTRRSRLPLRKLRKLSRWRPPSHSGAKRNGTGETGFGPRGDAAWAWLVNVPHIYFVGACLDLGPLQIEPHGHGWPITAGIQNWRWTCP
jgi:peptide/nickel transport system substrate-binding protein